MSAVEQFLQDTRATLVGRAPSAVSGTDACGEQGAHCLVGPRFVRTIQKFIRHEVKPAWPFDPPSIGTRAAFLAQQPGMPASEPSAS